VNAGTCAAGSLPAPVWHAHADADAWAQAAAMQIAQQLRDDLARAPQVLLLLSGGSTPEPVYRRLAAQMLDWSRVVVSLVDERFVAPGSAGSNATLLDRVFADGPAAAATRWPLVTPATTLGDCVAQTNRRMQAPGLRLSTVVFGMGEDGHCASLFPGATDLPTALAATQSFVAFDAQGCPVAEPYPLRITLTPSGWRDARCRVLLMSGVRKRAVFEQAAAGAEPLRLPVAAAIAEGRGALQVHWFPQEKQA
jgi:6-phosphogluconolactonase